METKTCDRCGAKFTTDRTVRRFCNEECRRIYWKQARIAGDAALVAAKKGVS